MDNHFHVVCEVEKPEKPVPENVVLDRIAILKGSEVAQSIEEHWDYLRKIGAGAAVEYTAFAGTVPLKDVGELVEKFGHHPVPKKMGIEMYATHGFVLAAEEDGKSAA